MLAANWGKLLKIVLIIVDYQKCLDKQNKIFLWHNVNLFYQVWNHDHTKITLKLCKKNPIHIYILGI